MSEYYQIKAGQPVYKGNLHSHTTNSDGRLTPSEAVELFKTHGYQFLCFSEHDLYTDYSKEFNCENFIILPGIEASAYLFDKEGGARIKCHHIHGILGTKKEQQEATAPLFSHMERFEPDVYYRTWDGAAVAQKLADKLRAKGCITQYNHPIWSRVREGEFIHTTGLWALEIFNYDTVNESGTGYDVTYWDVMLRDGKQIWGTATDDNHNPGTFDDCCGGWIGVQADELTHEAILEAMKSGNFYSSAGPKIHTWGIIDGKAYVSCSNVRRINFMTGNHINDGLTIMTDTVLEEITEGSYELKGHETYIRVECIDWLGRCAWSNPIYLEHGKPVEQKC